MNVTLHSFLTFCLSSESWNPQSLHCKAAVDTRLGFVLFFSSCQDAADGEPSLRSATSGETLAEVRGDTDVQIVRYILV